MVRSNFLYLQVIVQVIRYKKTLQLFFFTLFKTIITCEKNTDLTAKKCGHRMYKYYKNTINKFIFQSMNFTYPKNQFPSFSFENIFLKHWHIDNIRYQDYCTNGN